MADQQLTLGTLFTAKVHESLQSELNKMRRAVKGLASDLNQVQTSSQKLNKTTEDSAKAQRKSTAVVNKYTRAMNSLGRSMRTLVTYAGAGAVVGGITTAFTNGLNVIIEYDQGLKNLQAISGASTEQLGLMGDKMQYVATVTKFSTTELAEGMVLLTQAGFTAGEAIVSLDAVTTLATGTLSSMMSTTDLVTTAVRAFGLEADESKRIADVFANAVNKSKATIDKLRISFNYVATAASQANITLEEVSAAMMNLYNNGMRASSVGTGLRQVLSRLVAPNTKLREAFDRFGISVDAISPKTQGLEKALENLTPLLIDQSTGMIDMAKAFELFGLRGSQSIAILIKSIKNKDFEDSLEKVYEVGTAAEMSAKQQEGLAVRFKQLKDRAGVLAIAVGERGLAGAMGGLIDVGRGLLTLLIDFVKSPIGGAITGIAVLTGVVLALSAAFSALSVVIVPIIAAFTGFIGVGGAVASMFAGLAMAIYRYSNRTERAATAASKLMETHLASAESLTFYANLVQKLGEKMHESRRDTLAYRSSIQRLGEEYPELGKKIRELGDDYEAVHKIIKEASKAKADASAEAAVSNLRRFNKEYAKLASVTEVNKKRLQDALAAARERGDKRSAWHANFNLAKMHEQEGTNVDRLVQSYRNFVRARWKVQETEQYTLESAKNENTEKLKSLGLSDEVINQINTKMIPTYDTMGKIIKRAAEARKELNLTAKKDVRVADLKKDIKVVEGQIKLEEEAIKRKIEVASLKIAEDANYVQKRLQIEEDLNSQLSNTKDKLYEDLIVKYQQLADKEITTYDELIARKTLRAAEGATKISLLELKQARKSYKVQLKLDKKKAKEAELLAKERLKKAKANIDHLNKIRLIASQDAYNTEINDIKLSSETKFGYEHQAIIDTAHAKEDAAHRELEIRTETFNQIKNIYAEDTKEYQRAEEEKQKATVKFEDMRRGAQIATEEVKKLRSVWIQINRDAPAQISGGIASNLIDIAKNAKTAEEGIIDFAMSTLEWLARVIIQQNILNALQSVNWGGKPNLNQPPPYLGSVYGRNYGTAHTGGIIGKDTLASKFANPAIFANAPKFHTGGIVGDEVPIIAKKKEGVFTEEQMKALAPAEKPGGVSVNIVNKTGTKVARRQVNTKFDSNNKMVLDIVLEAVNENKSNFKRNMQSALSR